MNNVQRIRNNIDNFYKQKQHEQQQNKISRRNKAWSKYYGSKYWQHLRNEYYVMHPVCECCERRGIIKPANEVHHIRKWSSGTTEREKWELLLDKNNIVSLCYECHDNAHRYMQQHNTDTAGIDEILEIYGVD